MLGFVGEFGGVRKIVWGGWKVHMMPRRPGLSGLGPVRVWSGGGGEGRSSGPEILDGPEGEDEPRVEVQSDDGVELVVGEEVSVVGEDVEAVRRRRKSRRGSTGIDWDPSDEVRDGDDDGWEQEDQAEVAVGMPGDGSGAVDLQAGEAFGAWQFRLDRREVFAFWDYNAVCDPTASGDEPAEQVPVENTVGHVKKMLSMFGHIRGIWTFGDLPLDESRVEALVDDKRQLLRRMMWLRELPPISKREPIKLVRNEAEPYDPRFRIMDVNPDLFFKDRSWEVVFMTKIKLRCELCNSENKKMVDIMKHFTSRHAPEMNERAKDQLESDFRPYNHWWNFEDMVPRYMYALSCIGARQSPEENKSLHRRWYAAALGLRRVFVPRGYDVSTRVATEIRRALEDWNRRLQGFQKGKVRGEPALVVIGDERGKLLACVKEMKARYPGLIFVVVRPGAKEKPLHWADYNLDWDDVRNGIYEPITYDEEAKRKAMWDESHLEAVRLRLGAMRVRPKHRRDYSRKKKKQGLNS
mmetsp:Transcript_4716/g.9528  ORF Transcript_4716/g.9528 Transcript_4716/m.9528 type:complete len:523 (-) Transcript_4716:931-2499(-)